ncbi:MAG: type III secretion system chaperone family protein [Ferrimicrobium sp.]
MSEVKAVTTERITSVLKGLDVHYMVDEDGDVMAPFGVGTIRYQVWFISTQQGCLDCRVTLDRTIEPDQCPRVLSMLNAWNRDYRMPKVYLFFEDKGRGRITSQQFFPLEPGVDDELLLHLLRVAIATIGQFVAWIVEGLTELPTELNDSLSIEELEELFKRSA